jgi:hypothetical protein
MDAENALAREFYEVACAGVIAANPESRDHKRPFEALNKQGQAGWIALAKHVIASRPLKAAT